VHVNVIVDVDGLVYPEQIEELKVRMEALALGEVEVKKVRELRNG
jgi:S-adenosylmethionine:diacylglycerol 3-amino-3-carboxypropyl transferase